MGAGPVTGGGRAGITGDGGGGGVVALPPLVHGGACANHPPPFSRLFVGPISWSQRYRPSSGPDRGVPRRALGAVAPGVWRRGGGAFSRQEGQTWRSVEMLSAGSCVHRGPWKLSIESTASASRASLRPGRAAGSGPAVPAPGRALVRSGRSGGRKKGSRVGFAPGIPSSCGPAASSGPGARARGAEPLPPRPSPRAAGRGSQVAPLGSASARGPGPSIPQLQRPPVTGFRLGLAPEWTQGRQWLSWRVRGGGGGSPARAEPPLRAPRSLPPLAPPPSPLPSLPGSLAPGSPDQRSHGGPSTA